MRTMVKVHSHRNSCVHALHKDTSKMVCFHVDKVPNKSEGTNQGESLFFPISAAAKQQTQTGLRNKKLPQIFQYHSFTFKAGEFPLSNTSQRLTWLHSWPDDNITWYISWSTK